MRPTIGPMLMPELLPRRRRAASRGFGIGRGGGWRLWGAAGLMLGLAGCAGLNGHMQKQVNVLGGAVTVAAPSGYCIGPGTVTQTKDTAVVLMGRCIDAGFVAPAVISVSVGHPGSSGVMAAGNAALAKFFASRKGLSLVSRSGRASDVRLIGTDTDQSAFLMHLDDRLTGDYWRAILGLHGRLVTVTAVGTGKVPLAPAASRRVVVKTVQAMQNVNPLAPSVEPLTTGVTATATTVATATPAPATPVERPKGGLSVSLVPSPRPGERPSLRPTTVEVSPVPPPRPGENAPQAASPAKFVPLALAVPPGIVPPPRPGS